MSRTLQHEFIPHNSRVIRIGKALTWKRRSLALNRTLAMTRKKTPSQLTTSYPPELLAYIERRAAEVGLTRAVYLQQLVRQDMATEGRPFVLMPTKKKPLN